MASYDKLLGNNSLPESLLRILIRKKLSKKLSDETIDSIELFHNKFESHIEELKASPISMNTEMQSSSHNALPVEFFQLILGKRLKYSASLWDNCQTLDQAEEETMKMYCKKTDIQDGQKIMDLGCGWGSLTFYIAENFKNCTIIAITNNIIQKKYLEQHIKQHGLSNIKLVFNSINDYDTTEKFDRIISIETLEHLRNYKKLFEKLNFFLKDQGKILIQIFVNRNFSYTFNEKDQDDLLANYYLPGGTMPWNYLLYCFNDNFKVVNHWVFNGNHYYKTSDSWLQNLRTKKDMILPIFEQNYGKKEAKLWYNHWCNLFITLSEMYKYNDGNTWFTAFYLMVKNEYNQS